MSSDKELSPSVRDNTDKEICLIKISKVQNINRAIFTVLNEGVDNDNDTENDIVKRQIILNTKLSSLKIVELYYRDLKSLESELKYLYDMLYIAQYNNIISEMNTKLLHNGINYVLNAIKDYKFITQNENIKDKDNIKDIENEMSFIDQNYDSESIQNNARLLTYNTNKKDIKDFNFSNNRNKPTYNNQKDIRDKNANIKFQKDKFATEIKKDIDTKISNFNLNSFNDNRQSSRRQEILNSLSDDPISIKDISNYISGCSEKTIQRELNALLEEGRIKKIGEKRWSRYLLV